MLDAGLMTNEVRCVFNRVLTVNVRTTDGKTVSVDGVFMDSYHELYLNIIVSMDDFTIVAANSECRRIPLPDCHHVQEQVKYLVGLKMAKGIRRKIQNTIGSDYGCTHMVELAMECVRTLVAAKYSLMRGEMSNAEVMAKVEASSFFKGSCYHFRTKKEI
ncbi:MAG: DUF2889 domain-containing protein [Desulfitobacteriaceae bacterium]